MKNIINKVFITLIITIVGLICVTGCENRESMYSEYNLYFTDSEFMEIETVRYKTTNKDTE